jgi:hypothetical protein
MTNVDALGRRPFSRKGKEDISVSSDVLRPGLYSTTADLRHADQSPFANHVVTDVWPSSSAFRVVAHGSPGDL